MLVVALVVALGAWNYLRPIPAVVPTASLPKQDTVPGTAPTIPWPGAGSAAVGVSGLGFIASSGNEHPIAATSVAKVMTALIILTDKPLQKGQQGPSITITDLDVQAYRAELARAADLHLTHTTFTDTSGVSPQTVSTPSDLMALSMVAMRLRVFAQIVGLPQADLPIAGTVYNVDGVVGQSGIVGIKTGSGLEAGANFLFAATASVDGRPVTVYGCVMGQPTLARAFAPHSCSSRRCKPACACAE